MKKLFKVEFKDKWGDDVYITAESYDDAASRALEIKFNEQLHKPLFNKDGDLEIEKTEFAVKRVELLTKNLY